jgi:hypothetical protein
MTNALSNNSLRQQIQQQQRRVQALRTAVYSQLDPSANENLLQELTQEGAKLHKLEQRLAAPPVAEVNDNAGSLLRGRLLGPETTGLRVEPTLNMQPLPTGIYHLLDPDTDPLLTVTIGNESSDRKPRRVCVKAFLEGLSAEAVRTVELKRGEKVTLKLLPTLFPERAKAVTEVQRATLHLRVEDLDGKPECHDTFPLVLLARTSSFNAVRRPDTGQLVDLTHYYGARVTPYAEALQERVRRAADLSDGGMMAGYQKDPDAFTRQVAALYQALREAGITYVNSVIDYGAPAGQATQRTRLPRESLALKSANCIDGTVLMASLLEGASLNPGVVLVPGHAFVGWQTWDDDSAEWRFLETTLIGRADFEAACRSGQRQYEEFHNYNPERLRMHRLTDLRARGIWPME